MNFSNKTLLSAVSLLAIGMASTAAFAQATTTDKTVAAKKADDTPDIIVTGIRASLRDAISQKRAATGVIESISTKDIGALPDVTIADELARLPGINATRDRGNDSQAAVRGLGPRLVLGLVNGREVASSEPDRNVRWEIYPSEAVQGATVYKSQSADLIAGGVAATIDIRTLRPLDYKGPSLIVRAGPQYNDGGKDIPNYSKWGERGSLEYIAKLGDNLAIALGGSYQKQKNGYNSFQGWGYNTVASGNAPILNGVATSAPWGAQTEVDALKETRYSLSGAAQWKPTSNFEINLDALYSDVKINENQFQQWYGGWGDWQGNNANNWDPYYGQTLNVKNGDLVGGTVAGQWNNGTVQNILAKYTEDKSLLATGLNMAWKSDDWKVKLDGSYSEAKRKNIWQAIVASFPNDDSGYHYPGNTTFNTAAGNVPTVTTVNDPANPAIVSSTATLSTQSDGPAHLQDDLAAIQLDLSREFHSGPFSSFDFGGRYSDRVKSQAYMTSGATLTQSNIPASMLSEFSVGGINVPNILYGNFDQLTNYLTGGVGFTTGGQNYGNEWRVHETDFEGYGKLTFASQGPWNGNFGVRVVSAKTSSDGYTTTDGGSTYSAASASHSYTYVLPSLNLTLDLDNKNKVRFGVARVMARPPLDELRIGRSLSLPTAAIPSGSAGNPNLNPFLATQADLSYEYYFHPESLLAISGYYKAVDDIVGYTTGTQVINGTNYTITGPFNGPGGDLYGAEFTFQTPFYFVPALKHFGVYANAALAGSNIHELAPTTNPFPMVGVAKFTSELDLWYSGHGIDARIGFKHHSPFTVIYGWDASQLTRLETENTLGASVSYQITHNFSMRFQANNLTNQVARYYYNNDPQQLARYDKYGRSYLLDFTFKY